ncbi:response regulator transcription factor [Paenibacillus thermotolerans]|uniref:response regulator transcription factor n=1 Tax=Paenibacillus thermotolerans TaxID=3027807 RepID=UPI0023678E6A|nr:MULTISPECIES: response regulator transcription factor [unclassified Paenibacillus]
MCKVLLVDDEVYARQGLKQLIDWGQFGFDTILEAGNGEEALEWIERERPELVVTDIRMPVLDGLQLIQAVKGKERHEPLFIIVSGFSDFKYAQQAMRFGVQDFILKPIDEEELAAALDRLTQQMPHAGADSLSNETKFEELLAGRADSKLMMELAVLTGIVEGQAMRYFIVEVNDLPVDFGEADLFQRLRHIKTTLSQTIVEYTGYPEVLLHEQQRGVYGFIAACSKRGAKTDWNLYIQSVQERLSSSMEGTVMVYGGSVAYRLDQLKESLRTANEARLRKYALGESKAVLFDDIAEIPVQNIELDNALYHRLLESVEESDFNRLDEAVSELFDAFRDRYFTPDAVGASISRCVMGIVRTLQEMDGDERELAALQPVLDALKHPVTLLKLRSMVSTFVSESASYIAEQRKKNGKGSIQKVKRYIETHYNENMSLKSIAAKFYMNPVYLGQLFKKSYGFYFNEFLLRHRVQEAKKLLRQTELRVYEIADRVGFSNSDYFVTQFEKVEGKTPSEYRNTLKAQRTGAGAID